ncbi:MAG: hypothetical protein NXI28_19880 [bacterium]|nr:hypothetical protein [bacterium]
MAAVIEDVLNAGPAAGFDVSQNGFTADRWRSVLEGIPQQQDDCRLLWCEFQ